MMPNKYDKRVFINCPFDAQYKPLFEAIVFAIHACGLRPRCALEIDDASEVRTGFECGLGIANFNDVKVGDILECFQVTKLSAAEAAAQGTTAARK